MIDPMIRVIGTVSWYTASPPKKKVINSWGKETRNNLKPSVIEVQQKRTSTSQELKRESRPFRTAAGSARECQSRWVGAWRRGQGPSHVAFAGTKTAAVLRARESAKSPGDPCPQTPRERCFWTPEESRRRSSSRVEAGRLTLLGRLRLEGISQMKEVEFLFFFVFCKQSCTKTTVASKAWTDCCASGLWNIWWNLQVRTSTLINFGECPNWGSPPFGTDNPLLSCFEFFGMFLGSNEVMNSDYRYECMSK